MLTTSAAFHLLGVPSSATDDDIKKAFRRLALLYHPDKGGCHEKMAKVNEAYELLNDPSRRHKTFTPDFFNPQPRQKPQPRPAPAWKPPPPPPRPRTPPPPPPPPLPPRNLTLTQTIADPPLAALHKTHRTHLAFSWTNVSKAPLVNLTIHKRHARSDPYVECWRGKPTMREAEVVLENEFGDMEFCIKCATSQATSNASQPVATHIYSPLIRPFFLRFDALKTEPSENLNACITTLHSQRQLLQALPTPQSLDKTSKQHMSFLLDTLLRTKMADWKIKLTSKTADLLKPTSTSSHSPTKVFWPFISNRDWKQLPRGRKSQWIRFIESISLDGAYGVLNPLTASAVKKHIGHVLDKAISGLRVAPFMILPSHIVRKPFEKPGYESDVPIFGWRTFLGVYWVVMTVQAQAHEFGAESGEWTALVEFWLDTCGNAVAALRRDVDLRLEREVKALEAEEEMRRREVRDDLERKVDGLEEGFRGAFSMRDSGLGGVGVGGVGAGAAGFGAGAAPSAFFGVPPAASVPTASTATPVFVFGAGSSSFGGGLGAAAPAATSSTTPPSFGASGESFGVNSSVPLTTPSFGAYTGLFGAPATPTPSFTQPTTPFAGMFGTPTQPPEPPTSSGLFGVNADATATAAAFSFSAQGASTPVTAFTSSFGGHTATGASSCSNTHAASSSSDSATPNGSRPFFGQHHQPIPGRSFGNSGATTSTTSTTPLTFGPFTSIPVATPPSFGNRGPMTGLTSGPFTSIPAATPSFAPKPFVFGTQDPVVGLTSGPFTSAPSANPIPPPASASKQFPFGMQEPVVGFTSGPFSEVPIASSASKPANPLAPTMNHSGPRTKPFASAKTNSVPPAFEFGKMSGNGTTSVAGATMSFGTSAAGGSSGAQPALPHKLTSGPFSDIPIASSATKNRNPFAPTPVASVPPPAFEFGKMNASVTGSVAGASASFGNAGSSGTPLTFGPFSDIPRTRSTPRASKTTAASVPPPAFEFGKMNANVTGSASAAASASFGNAGLSGAPPPVGLTFGPFSDIPLTSSTTRASTRAASVPPAFEFGSVNDNVTGSIAASDATFRAPAAAASSSTCRASTKQPVTRVRPPRPLTPKPYFPDAVVSEVTSSVPVASQIECENGFGGGGGGGAAAARAEGRGESWSRGVGGRGDTMPRVVGGLSFDGVWGGEGGGGKKKTVKGKKKARVGVETDVV
ncbi:hypothetical protein HDU98_009603 [Podochytrium sp. JEL0797]|nr:hypothetical protein HDU98_009603 [Podochytrium sp. JEL0797]